MTDATSAAALMDSDTFSARLRETLEAQLTLGHPIFRELFTEGRAGTAAREEADRALAYLREGHTMDELDERLLHRWEEIPPPPPVVEGEVPTEPAEGEADQKRPRFTALRFAGRCRDDLRRRAYCGRTTIERSCRLRRLKRRSRCIKRAVEVRTQSKLRRFVRPCR